MIKFSSKGKFLAGEKELKIELKPLKKIDNITIKIKLPEGCTSYRILKDEQSLHQYDIIFKDGDVVIIKIPNIQKCYNSILHLTLIFNRPFKTYGEYSVNCYYNDPISSLPIFIILVVLIISYTMRILDLFLIKN